MHSVMNSLFAKVALKDEFANADSLDIYEHKRRVITTGNIQ